MEHDKRFVEFDKWCNKCKHSKESEFDRDSECYVCLDTVNVVNDNSTKPIRFIKNDTE